MTNTAQAAISQAFRVEKPRFDARTRTASFPFLLGTQRFTESLVFPKTTNINIAQTAVFQDVLNMTALVLGVSYFKLTAPFEIEVLGFDLTKSEHAFTIDLYENGLAEFYARNNLQRFGRLTLHASISARNLPAAKPALDDKILLPIGGGKDSLVSVQLLEKAGLTYTPFAVNPKGPILSSVEVIGKPGIYVERRLDPEMIRLSSQAGYYNGHVPSTAINSMIAALVALLRGFDTIALSNERSASEGNVAFDGRIANHQYSKSIAFERNIANILSQATHGAISYFSLLRPYSEAKIASLFARETRFDQAFSSCNQNFRLAGHDGALWCGACPKCHFTFLILAPQMAKQRLVSIFDQNLLDQTQHEKAYRELTGLCGQKPWECVGEILEAAACLWILSKQIEWQNARIVQDLKNDLERHYGAEHLELAYKALMADSPEHHIPAHVLKRVTPYAH